MASMLTGPPTATPVITSIGHSPDFNQREWGPLDTPQASSEDTNGDQGTGTYMVDAQTTDVHMYTSG